MKPDTRGRCGGSSNEKGWSEEPRPPIFGVPAPPVVKSSSSSENGCRSAGKLLASNASSLLPDEVLCSGCGVVSDGAALPLTGRSGRDSLPIPMPAISSSERPRSESEKGAIPMSSSSDEGAAAGVAGAPRLAISSSDNPKSESEKGDIVGSSSASGVVGGAAAGVAGAPRLAISSSDNPKSESEKGDIVGSSSASGVVGGAAAGVAGAPRL